MARRLGGRTGRRIAAAGLSVLLGATIGGAGAVALAGAGQAAAVPATLAPPLAPATAPTPPSPKAIDYTATLASSGQSLGGPGAEPAPTDVSHTWFDQTWNASGGFDDVTDVSFDPCEYIPLVPSCTIDFGSYGATLTAGSQGEIGMGDTVHGYQPGKVDVSYALNTRFTAPADDSFAPGDTVDVTTQKPAPQPASSITATSPSMSGISINATFGFHAQASGRVCVADCIGGSIFSLDLPSSGSATGSVLTLSASDLMMVQGMGLGRCFGAAEGALFGASTFPNDKNYCAGSQGDAGYVKLPNPQIGAGGAATSVSGTALTAQAKDQFIVVPISAITMLGKLVSLPAGFPSLNAGVGGTNVSITTLNVIITAVLSQTRALTFSPVVNVTTAFGRAIDYRVLDAGGNVVQHNTDTSATFPLGSTLRLVVPDRMTITPTLSMGDTAFRNRTAESLAGTAQIQALKLYASIGGCCDDIFGGIDVNIGPVYDSGAMDIGSTDLHADDNTWQLGGFNTRTLASFQLVPDPPPVPTAKTLAPVEGATFANQVVATFHDPDLADAANVAATDYTARITWGDGQTSVGTIAGTNSSFTVSGTNLYEEEGSYPVDVTVTDTTVPTVMATAHSRAVVSDAALTVVDQPHLTSVEGAPTSAGTRVASFTDADPHGAVADFSATVAWGDGTTSLATVVAGSNGRFDVLAPSHTYEEEGSPTVVVSIADEGGSKATARPPMLTSDAALTAGAPVTNGTLWGGSTPVLLWPNPGNAVVATFTDDDPHGTVSDYTATITWGDGSTSTGIVSPAANPPAGKTAFKVTASHTYADAQLGQHPISILIQDEGGASTTAYTRLLAYTFPTGGGVFSLGDTTTRTATTSTVLNYWGSQWSKANQVSGAATPSSFKGFVSGPPTLPSPPASCPTSGTFTTRPGTSSAPPATVPSYMAVMVGSQVNKDGSVISGGPTSHWVIVKTRPGYDPAAGHDGTATIVASIC